MGRGKTKMARIENQVARQVTFSKRRVGLFKKSHELSVLCDAEIACIIFSCNGNPFEFCSESSSLQNIITRYLFSKGLQMPLYDSEGSPNFLYGELKRMREEIDDLELSVKRHTGQALSSLHYEDLMGLEKQLQSSVNKVRTRKFELLQEQIHSLGRKVKLLYEENEQIQYHLTRRENQVAVMEPAEDNRQVTDQFYFLGEDPCSELQLAPLPPQFQPDTIQPTQPSLQDFSLHLINYE